MAQAGLHAAIGYSMRHIIPYEKGFLPAVIFGAILPDLDILIVAIASIFYPILQAEYLFHRTFSHSFFTLIIIYLVFSIIAEWKGETIFKTIGKGLTLGILSHIILDTFLWFREIQFLWPLPLEPFNFWNFWIVPEWFHNVMLVMEFFCFYWYAWFLIVRHIKLPNKHSWVIIYLQRWKFIEGILIVSFIFLIYWKPTIFFITFGAAYIPSIVMALWATYMSRDALEMRKINKSN